MSNTRKVATPKAAPPEGEPDSFRLATWDEMQSYLHGIRAGAGSGNLDRIADALEAIAAAINRHADAYLHVNLPQEEPSFEGQSLSDSRPESSLPGDFRGAR